MNDLSSLGAYRLGRAVLIGGAVFFSACGSSGGSATASASASAAAPVKSASSAAKASATVTANEPAIAGQKVKVKLSSEGFDGDYDGSKVLFQKRYGGTMVIRLEKDCPQFSCSAYFDDSMEKACPKGTTAG